MTKLTDKQEAFVREYLVDLNGTQAAIRAGYAEKNARVTAAQNLSKPNIESRISELKAERAERLELTSDMVMEELRRVGFSDLRQLASWNPDTGLTWKSSEEIDDEAAASVKDIQFTREVRRDKNGDEVETTNTTLKLHDKLAALKSLGQHLGMFGKDGGGVTVNVNNAPPAKPLSDFTDAELDFYEKLLDTDSAEANADASNRRA